MSTITIDDLHNFAQKVENLCDFFLNKLSDENQRDGSADVMILENLKKEAADIQFIKLAPTEITIYGLDSYMRGLPHQTKE